MPVQQNDGCEISSENYTFLQREVYKTSGIVLDETKQYLLEARLLPIARREKLKTVNELCSLMRATSRVQLAKEVTEAMTTNETLFFRDAAPFKAIREKLLPPLLEKRKSTRTLKFWSAASSSGQEAYSLAMMLLEMGLQDWNIQILGTDLSERMVDRAQAGRYIQIEVNRGLPAPYLVKYFERHGLEWQLNDRVRRMATFRPFDLRSSMSTLGQFDFVFCRNVLIYFDVATKKSILKQIEGTMTAGAGLILGAAETTMGLSNSFERQTIEGATFYIRR